MLSKDQWRRIPSCLLICFLLTSASNGQRFAEAPVTGIEGAYPLSLDWADFDNDGDLDLAIGDLFDLPNMSLYRQTAPLQFQNVGAALPPAKMVSWGDYNGDGWLDFLSASSSGLQWVSWIYKNDQKGGFTPAVQLNLQSSATFADWGDYDNDGDLDLLVSSFLETGKKAQVWRNDGFDGFTLTAIDLPESYYSECYFVDLDGDGALDIFASQKADDLLFWPAIYKNNGGGNFALANRLDTVKQGSSASFADFDRDGDLDILLTGATGGFPVTAVFRNDGNFTFTALQGPMDRFGWINPVFADFDNNGTADALIGADQEPPWGKPLQLFLSNAQGQFTDPGEVFGAVSEVSNRPAVADVDNDGALDVLRFFQLGGSQTALYTNASAMKNSKPEAPANLQSAVTAAGVTFSWDASADPNQNGGLTYNLRVGTKPGANDVLSSMSDPATGWRRVVRNGNTGVRRSWTLQIPSARYYWSVQAVDYSYAGSPFAAEQTTDVPPGPPLVNISDIPRPVLGDVQFRGVVHPNGGETLAYFEYGTNTFDLFTETFVLPANGGYTNLFTGATNLALAAEWRVRLVASNAFGVTRSAEKLFVTENELPTVVLAVPSSQVSVAPMTQTADIPFIIGDRETPTAALKVRAETSNSTLVPLENIVFSGADAHRSLRITATTNLGSVNITIIVTDSLNAEARTTLNVKIESFGQLRVFYSALRAGDLNRDGLLDVLSTYGSRFQTNLGQMRFRTGTLPSNTTLSAALFSDFDRDGILDLAVCSAFTTATAFTSGLYFGADNGLMASTPLIALPFRTRAAFESADFDGDGAPDLLALGATNSAQQARPGPILLCGSASPVAFQPKRIGSRTFDYPAVAAGDLDGDGRTDFICTGMTNSVVPPVMLFYHNEGRGNFTESQINLPGLTGGGLALADIDNDGDLDLALSGSATASLNTGATAAIYKNNGDATFVLHQRLTNAVHHASIQWGDFDGDGDYDLLLNGYRDGNVPSIQILINANGSFTPIVGLATLPAGVGSNANAGNAEWADLDGDGDLDILVGGSDGAAIYRNNLNPPNFQASAPTGLRVRQFGERTVLEWDAPVDAANMSLTYNVRLGSITQKDNYIPSMADPVSGKRWITRRGNAENRNQMTITGLPPGKYFWSVQTISPSYVGSPFAAESSVYITGPDDLQMEAVNFSASGAPIIRVHAPVAGELTIQTSPDLTAWTTSRILQVRPGANDLEINLPNTQTTLFVRSSLKL
jgi:hypothetical protein